TRAGAPRRPAHHRRGRSQARRCLHLRGPRRSRRGSVKAGDHWPVVFAAMEKAAATKDVGLAEAAASLVAARSTADAARHHYRCLATYIARTVGVPDPIEDEPEGAPPALKKQH